MGLFNIFKKPIPNESKESDTERKIRELREMLDYQNKLLESVLAADEQYKNDKDLDARIAAYEHAFIEAEPMCESTKAFELAKMYIKKEEYQKAWSYLGKLSTVYVDEHRDKVSELRCKVLIKEKKFDDALRQHCLMYFQRYSWRHVFEQHMFEKGTATIYKGLQLTEEQIDSINEFMRKSMTNKLLTTDIVFLRKFNSFWKKQND